jgi:hypothetical protein
MPTNNYTINICKKIESIDYEQFEEDGVDIDEICEILASRYQALHEASKMAEMLISKMVDMNIRVDENQSAILTKLKNELQG